MLHEVVIDIFERPVCRLRVKEVNEWHEGEVEDGPNDVELPA